MEELTSMCDRMSLTAKEGGRVDLSDSQEVVGGLLAAKFLTKSRGKLTPDKQEYGAWLRGELPRFSRREGLGRGFPPREFSSSEPRRERSPVRSSGVAVHAKSNMATPEFTPSAMKEKEEINFQAKLKEIDHELGLDHGELNESLEILLQGASQSNFQIPEAGLIRNEDNSVGLVPGEPNGPHVDHSGPQGPNKKSLGSTWKRLVRKTNGPQTMAQQSILPKQKRSQNIFLEEEVVRDLKKSKVQGSSSGNNEDQISAEVALQPCRTP
ncbi:hypothetical protein FCV25MIE_34375 [Fagus crenata]